MWQRPHGVCGGGGRGSVAQKRGSVQFAEGGKGGKGRSDSRGKGAAKGDDEAKPMHPWQRMFAERTNQQTHSRYLFVKDPGASERKRRAARAPSLALRSFRALHPFRALHAFRALHPFRARVRGHGGARGQCRRVGRAAACCCGLACR